MYACFERLLCTLVLKIRYKDTIKVCFTSLRSENINFPYLDSAQKLPTPLRQLLLIVAQLFLKNSLLQIR